MTNKMVESLNLNEEQAKELAKVNLEFGKKRAST